MENTAAGRQVCEELYRTGPADCAEMKTWDHFHRGMYLAQWEFMPLRRIANLCYWQPTIWRSNHSIKRNKTFTIKALDNSKENIYIQSAKLNGTPFNRTWIAQNEITTGGELVFQMGPKPNKNWGTASKSAPPSMSKEK